MSKQKYYGCSAGLQKSRVRLLFNKWMGLGCLFVCLLFSLLLSHKNLKSQK